MSITRRRFTAALGLGAVFGRAGAKAATVRPALPAMLRWAVDYGPAPDPDLAPRFDLLVLEADHGHDLTRLRGEGRRVLAYLSLGEVADQRPYAEDLRRLGLLGIRNVHWPDARYIDLRDPRWTAMVLDRLVPALLDLGYDGLFFDTLDNAEAMERADPIGAAGMVAAAISLVRDIRRRFPSVLLMLNRGYALLPEVAGEIDILLAEAMAARWSFRDRRYERMSESDWTWQAERLRAARAVHPALRLATLDYWDMGDTATVRDLYALERQDGFSPYVSMLALDRLYPEPA
ncbi:hypothetical protein GCM10011390_06350 [Aureimonas endophytica]|uniref:Glycoside-hydrolase family GH114 TIM-barrel domain-containing protein n=1 Tax=Aureimonas endophytica TaxID=2027858 RepID=A0A916ZDM3_9HYPH|nr:endo alpha-1,4 polygalactosaminidase [Aureimonas endophytica]GGD90303.1 hypothetical protein GCM10011390_06350 [Aureimonas endophytica]